MINQKFLNNEISKLANEAVLSFDRKSAQLGHQLSWSYYIEILTFYN